MTDFRNVADRSLLDLLAALHREALHPVHRVVLLVEVYARGGTPRLPSRDG